MVGQSYILFFSCIRVVDIMQRDAEKDPATNPNARYARRLINQVSWVHDSEMAGLRFEQGTLVEAMHLDKLEVRLIKSGSGLFDGCVEIYIAQKTSIFYFHPVDILFMFYDRWKCKQLHTLLKRNHNPTTTVSHGKLGTRCQLCHE